ncbi:MAG: hypothetical protein JEZ08_16030 [Clostridiales bacterium]|nr:hypothetical protein [Clostridiales bacterium]
MKDKQMNVLIRNYINENNHVDISQNVMDSVKQSPITKVKKTNILLVAVLSLAVFLLACSAIEVIKLFDHGEKSLVVHLKPGNNDLLTALDQEVLKPDNDLELMNKTKITVDTKDVSNYQILGGERIDGDYEHYRSLSDDLLPDSLGDFIFHRVELSEVPIIPTVEELAEIANSHQEEAYYTFALAIESLAIEVVEYKLDNDHIYTIDIVDNDNDEITLLKSSTVDYEVITLNEKDAFIYIRYQLSASKLPDESAKYNEIENDYELFWKSDNQLIRIRPARKTRVFIGENQFKYPMETKENIIQLARLIDQFK